MARKSEMWKQTKNATIIYFFPPKIGKKYGIKLLIEFRFDKDLISLQKLVICIKHWPRKFSAARIISQYQAILNLLLLFYVRIAL